MAIYTNLEAVAHGTHGIVELSNLKSTTVGNIYDVIVRNSEGTAIAVDNGVAIAVGAYTGDGLQTRYATVAATTDTIAIVSTPAVIKDAFTKNQAQEWNFYNKAGAVARAHEVVADDIFGVADYQFSAGTIATGATVVVDGNGGWKVVESATTEKFVGQIINVATASNSKIVRIRCIKNA